MSRLVIHILGTDQLIMQVELIRGQVLIQTDVTVSLH